MLKIKTLLMAAAVSTGVVLAMPAVSSQAMPASAPVRMDSARNGNLVQVYYKRRYWHQGWNHHHHHHHRYFAYRYYSPYYHPYYGYYEPYPYYYGYYPHYYRPYYYGPGIGFSFHF